MISQALRIHESTVARHLSDYVLSEKLKPENGGSQGRLSAGQTIQLIEHYNETLRNSEDPVLFMNAVHPTQSTKLSYGWIRRGQDKVIETTGSRT